MKTSEEVAKLLSVDNILRDIRFNDGVAWAISQVYKILEENRNIRYSVEALGVENKERNAIMKEALEIKMGRKRLKMRISEDFKFEYKDEKDNYVPLDKNLDEMLKIYGEETIKNSVMDVLCGYVFDSRLLSILPPLNFDEKPKT